MAVCNYDLFTGGLQNPATDTQFSKADFTEVTSELGKALVNIYSIGEYVSQPVKHLGTNFKYIYKQMHQKENYR